MKKLQRQRVFVEDTRSGKKVTLNSFKKSANAQLLLTSVTKKEIINDGLLTKKELEAFIVKYKIPVTVKSRIAYIDRELFLENLAKHKRA